MIKNILTIFGPASQGKSTTIKNLIPLFEESFPDAKFNWIINNYDIKLIIEIGNKKIGIESQGDPNSRLEDSISSFAVTEKCDLIICASRSRGKTVNIVETVAIENDYEVIWVTNYRTGLNQSLLNEMSANHIFQLIKTLI